VILLRISIHSAACACVFLLAACASLPAGEDEAGVELKAKSAKVLTAIAQFGRERGRYPTSMYELVPRYLPELPDEPILHINDDTGTVGFVYSRPGFPGLTRISCSTRLGTAEWHCSD